MFGKRSVDRKHTDPTVVWNMFSMQQQKARSESKRSYQDRMKQVLAHEPRIDTVLPQPKSRSHFYSTAPMSASQDTGRIKRERKV